MGTVLFYSCGGCEHYHPLGWTGDCRDDLRRFTAAELDAHYGETWREVDENTGEPA